MGDRGGIGALLDLMEEAFRGRDVEASNESQALLPNLATVPADIWTALPTGAARSIAAMAIVDHLTAVTDDAELDRLRQTNWGEMRPTRWIVGAMITHDAYHAGEIDHLRSLLGSDDRWRFQQLGFG